MKRKELKNLAKKIAKAELIVQNSSDVAEVNRAQQEIMDLSSKVSSIEEMIELDDLIQEIISENTGLS